MLFTCVAGSRAYGTHTHESDEDTRGIYAVRADRYLDLDTPLPQLADERGNTVYFSLRRFIELLAVANPNVLLNFDQIMEIANGVMADCERLKSNTNLPDTCDKAAATCLLRDVTRQWESRIFA